MPESLPKAILFDPDDNVLASLEKFECAWRRLEPVDMQQIRIWRSMTPAQRADLAGQLYRLAVEIVRATERQRHPEASEEDLRWRVIRRLHGDPRLGRD